MESWATIRVAHNTRKMALTLQDLLGEPKQLAVAIKDGVSLNIKYFPDFITEEFETKAKALESATDDAAKRFNDLLAPILESWDLEGVECTREALANVPAVFLAKVMAAIFDDARPNPPTASS